MSKSSEAVKRWRKNTKARMVEAMGGKCQICSYDKTHKALEFHHIDPTEKEMAFGETRANNVKWAKLVEELRKCILLCSNCHKEVHEGITQLPQKFNSFNEDFAEYKNTK
jgi:5-methylcytosine-specific restriction endonuclease McrA